MSTERGDEGSAAPPPHTTSEPSNAPPPDTASEPSNTVSIGTKRTADDLSGEVDISDAQEPGDEVDARRKRAKIDTEVAGDGRDELEAGEVEIQSPSPDSPSGAVKIAAEAKPSHKGWNQGVNSGLRLSFGKSVQATSEPGEVGLELSEPSGLLDLEEPLDGRSETSEASELAEGKKFRKHVKKRFMPLPEPIPAQPVIIPLGIQKKDAKAGFWGLSADERRAYTERYFPALTADQKQFCVMCMSSTHSPDDCPDLQRGLGHPSRILPAVPAGEKCRDCVRNYHSDVNIWRTYEPDQKPLLKVKSLPHFCCNCGGPHSRDNCNLYPVVEARFCIARDGAWHTWSDQHWERYVDVNSTWEAIQPPRERKESPGRPNLGPYKTIVPKRHVVFEAGDDDDDNEPFLQQPVQKKSRAEISIRGRASGQQSGGQNLHQLPPPPLPLRPTPAPAPGGKQRGGKKNRRN
ncbi:hypothetical protein QBC47DRAFT_119243 [Echria macrotheca]|uniref:Uncharacterized protein n=1 Tax=Echria macrotheca TaxID=438768 RepID=A0AAJ0B2S2_9PEZI|nr:hypothetical protein QBC47DRAFT_119243 [Echria macrotheca]